MTLKDYIVENCYSQNEFAKLAKISPQAITHYIQGKRKPRPSTARRIEELTNGAVRAKDLLYDKKE